MAFYSSNGIDELVKGYLPEFGYACDVGANNGELYSNTKHFEDNGWLCLCIEPNPLLEEEGRRRRKLWRQVACGSSNGEAEFCSVGCPPYASNSGLRPGLDGSKYMVKVVRLDDLLEQAGFPRLDFLSIDSEGWEDEVMAGFTVERWKPKVIVREDWGETIPEINGYRHIARKEYDNVYLRED